MSLDINAIQPGLTASTEIVVGTRDTAHHVGSGKIKVLATPIMVMLMEEAALTAIEGLLPDGCQSVGTRLDINHIAATPVGMRVTATAEVVHVDGRKVTFKVQANDEHDLIGEGHHDRVVVELVRFDNKVREKAENTKAV